MIITGIGSRETPADVIALMELIGADIAQKGHTLRSGGADGADEAFERGARTVQNARIEVYLPWRKFNGHSSQLHTVSPAAMDMAAQFHPAWKRCSLGARKLHARNSYQVLGADLATPSDLVICWTRNASGAGGTGQALRIARAHGITIHDLGNPARLEQYAARYT